MEEENKIKTWPYMTFTSLAKAMIFKLATFGFVWSMGYMNWNFAWVFPAIIFVAIKTERNNDGNLKRLVSQASSLANEKILITNRIDELPTWVYFPDYDRAEWLNSILYKLWPSMNHYIRDLCKTTIQSTIQERMNDYKSKIPGVAQGFQFDRIVLGRIPPKINGIKVYEKHTSRNEIVMDMDVMYAGDCDITFMMGNLKAGIKDFQLRGMMRVTMKPLIPIIPLVGGVQVFFLNNPIIDFNLVGLADVFDLPGFSDVLRKIISEQIAAFAVLPNKFIMPLTAEISPEIIKTPEPEGVLRIHVVEAKHLMKKDIGMLGKGKSDPYAVITVGAEEFRTKTIDNTVDPKWDYWCECVISSAIAQQLIIHIWDFDDTKNNEYLGRAVVEVNRVKKKGTIDTWITLELAKHGMIHLRLTWLQLTSDISDLAAAIKETQELRVTSMSTAVLILYVDSAKNLPCLKGSKQPDVYFEGSIGGQTKRTGTMLRSCDPVWEQGFTFLVANPETGVLNIKIHDEKTTTIIGTFNYNISNLMSLNNLEIKQQPFALQSNGVESKIILSMILRIIKYVEPEAVSEDEADHDITNLNKKIERQESSLSNKVPDSPLKRQPSKDSIRSTVNNNLASAPNDQTKPWTMDPVEELIIRETAPEPVWAVPPHLIHRQPSITSSAGEFKLGRIQITLRYSVPRQKLVIVIHKVANLPLPVNDPSNIPDPYVKLYLLPDRHKDTKRKTAVVKDNCNPTFDEQFEYIISQGDINTKTLELSVCTQKGWLSTGSNVMGQLRIHLSEIDFTQTITSWYDLQPESKE